MPCGYLKLNLSHYIVQLTKLLCVTVIYCKWLEKVGMRLLIIRSCLHHFILMCSCNMCWKNVSQSLNGWKCLVKHIHLIIYGSTALQGDSNQSCWSQTSGSWVPISPKWLLNVNCHFVLIFSYLSDDAGKRCRSNYAYAEKVTKQQVVELTEWGNSM